MEPVVSVKNLTKRFGKITAVNGILFDIQEGEIFGLLGPNGAGKTTTIQMLLGVLTPDAGEISIFGKSFQKHREEILLQTNFSSSYISLPWNLTVEENLKLFARLYGVANAAARIDELLTQFSFTEERSRLTGKLSSGQLTRLFLAKTLLNRPKLLLLDEPTASLDPEIADRTRQLIRRLAKEEGTTIVYTSHNMPEVESLCDRVAFLQHGRFLVIGQTKDILTRHGHRNLEETFIHFVRSLEQSTVE